MLRWGGLCFVGGRAMLVLREEEEEEEAWTDLVRLLLVCAE